MRVQIPWDMSGKDRAKMADKVCKHATIVKRHLTPEAMAAPIKIDSRPGEYHVLLASEKGDVYEVTGRPEDDAWVLEKAQKELWRDKQDVGTITLMASNGGSAEGSGKCVYVDGLDGGRAVADGTLAHASATGNAFAEAHGYCSHATAVAGSSPAVAGGLWAAIARSFGANTNSYTTAREGGQAEAIAAEAGLPSADLQRGTEAQSHASGQGSVARSTAKACREANATSVAGAHVTVEAASANLALRGAGALTHINASNHTRQNVQGQFDFTVEGTLVERDLSDSLASLSHWEPVTRPSWDPIR